MRPVPSFCFNREGLNLLVDSVFVLPGEEHSRSLTASVKTSNKHDVYLSYFMVGRCWCWPVVDNKK